MNANQKTIESNSVAADPSRPLHGVAPFRVIAGRGVIDARGRLVLTCRHETAMHHSGMMVLDGINALFRHEADDNAHAVAAALNMAHGMRDAIRAAVATIDACGSISETTLDMLRQYGNGGRLECVPRDPNVSPRVGDELPLNAPRLSLPEPRGDGSQAGDGFALLVNADELMEMARDFAGLFMDGVAGFPLRRLSGALVRIEDGEYVEVWITDSARPYDLRTARYVCIAAPDNGSDNA